jgi:hypothetical protein
MPRLILIAATLLVAAAPGPVSAQRFNERDEVVCVQVGWINGMRCDVVNRASGSPNAADPKALSWREKREAAWQAKEALRIAKRDCERANKRALAAGAAAQSCEPAATPQP